MKLKESGKTLDKVQETLNNLSKGRTLTETVTTSLPYIRYISIGIITISTFCTNAEYLMYFDN